MTQIQVQESAQNQFHDIEELETVIKNLLLKEKCINCAKLIKDNQKIDYVLLTSGKIRLWHHRDDNGAISCPK